MKPIIHRDKVKDESVLKEAMDICPTQVFAKEGERVVVKYPEKCIGCRACESVAPDGEITLID